MLLPHRDLPALGGILRLRLFSGDGFKRCWGRARKLADRRLHYSAMPERDADVLEVLIGQIAERRDIDLVLGKYLSVLSHAELFEPLCNRCGAHDDNSFSNAFASFRSSVSNPSVN